MSKSYFPLVYHTENQKPDFVVASLQVQGIMLKSKLYSIPLSVNKILDYCERALFETILINCVILNTQILNLAIRTLKDYTLLRS